MTLNINSKAFADRTFSHITLKFPSFPMSPDILPTRTEISFKVVSVSDVIISPSGAGALEIVTESNIYNKSCEMEFTEDRLSVQGTGIFFRR